MCSDSEVTFTRKEMQSGKKPGSEYIAYNVMYGGVASFCGGTVFMVPLFWHNDSSNPQGFYQEYKGKLILQCS
jgi:hypothetical protein